MRLVLRNNLLLAVVFFVLWFSVNLLGLVVPWQVAAAAIFVLFVGSFAASFVALRRFVRAAACAFLCTVLTVVASIYILAAIFGLKGWH